MTFKPNPRNEKIKRAYFHYRKEADGASEATIDGLAKALRRFEESTGARDFCRFHREQAVAFKRRLAELVNCRTGELLSKATMHSTLKELRRFFIWLAGQPGFKSKLRYSDADYFNLSDKDVAVALAVRDKPFPTLEQMHHVIGSMQSSTDIEMRNRALIAFCLLTGARADALATVRMRHVDMANGFMLNDGRDMRTKASKTFPTYFMPVGGSALEILTGWVQHLRSSLLWGDNDPLFPATDVSRNPDTNLIEPVGLSRQTWSTSGPVRDIFKAAFEFAGLPYFNPHGVRKTLVQLGERLCRTPEEFKAWSQNMGHSGVLTTLTSYGEVARDRQGEIMKKLCTGAGDQSDDDDLAAQLQDFLARRRRLK